MSDSDVVTLTINGIGVSARANESIIDVAGEQGIFIPRLCQLDGLSPAGACRMCLVEVQGAARLVPACVTRVAEGMTVNTESERLDHYRRRLLELLFAERNHVCAVCVANGACELQFLAAKTGMTHAGVPYRYDGFEIDASHERYFVDHNRCILCTRCVRVCGEIEGAHTWGVAGRGGSVRVVTDLNQAWGKSDTCTSCGKCVNVCPTGALGVKGSPVAGMPRRNPFLPYLTMMRGDHP